MEFLNPPLESEILAPEEIAEITGRARKEHQAAWLDEHGWIYVRNAAGVPIVGRFYARLKMAGVNLQTSVASGPVGGTLPDFSKVR
ncbi:MAG: DUF4224 domain-containing protein [Betaproteobacteria bacterium]|nr:DUF4224 domain-containing protein [Betaproteobacteria bacterium]